MAGSSSEKEVIIGPTERRWMLYALYGYLAYKLVTLAAVTFDNPLENWDYRNQPWD